MTIRSLPAIAWTALIALICVVPHSWLFSHPPSDEPSWIDLFLVDVPLDKVVHVGMFAVFGLLWRLARASTRATWLGGLALAAATELVQAIPALGRSSDLPDLLADLGGLAFALLIARPRRSRSRPPEHAAVG